MNKKGFTLVELLAVIIVLAILVLLAIPRVIKFIESSRVNAFAVEANQIIKSARNAYGDELITEEEVNLPVCYTVAELVKLGYLDDSDDVSGAVVIDFVNGGNTDDKEAIYTYLSKDGYYIIKNNPVGKYKIYNSDVVRNEGENLYQDCTAKCVALAGGTSIQCVDSEVPENVSCDANIGDTWTVTESGSLQTWTPPCSGTYIITASGGPGGESVYKEDIYSHSNATCKDGSGYVTGSGVVEAIYKLSKTQDIKINIGGAGGSAYRNGESGPTGTGGWNGGSNGNKSGMSGSGGHTDVYINEDLILQARGGNGIRGGYNCYLSGTVGGGGSNQINTTHPSYISGDYSSSNTSRSSYVKFKLISYNTGCNITPGTAYDFAYNGEIQAFSAPCSGTYKLEAWGAQGVTTESYGWWNGGNGGYATGNLTMESGDNIFVVVGGTRTARSGTGGYNGGGNSADAAGGGGATHFARTGNVIDKTLKTDLILVAGGGGGAGAGYNSEVRGAHGGAAGGLTGQNGKCYYCGYSVGKGAAETCASEYGGKGGSTSIKAGGGGGGYCGGGAGGYYTGGGGGSSYFGGVTNGQTLSGTELMPTHDDTEGTQTGNTGDGYARITYMGG